MKARINTLCVVVTGYYLGAYVFTTLSTSKNSSAFYPNYEYPPTDNVNAEALFALGRQIHVQSVTQIELELIPGVSTVMATRIIESLQANGSSISNDQELRVVLESTKGVGPERARLLLKYLTATESPRTSNSHSP